MYRRVIKLIMVLIFTYLFQLGSVYSIFEEERLVLHRHKTLKTRAFKSVMQKEKAVATATS